ncbi:MAG: DUF3562 domain-containing protein [Gammaproteobacteria bacterium]|jgi:hypothetical protein
MAIQYASDEERKLHANIIYSLANQYHLDEAMIRELYESRLESLMDVARVRIYLPILVARYVRNLLSRPQMSDSAEVPTKRYH